MFEAKIIADSIPRPWAHVPQHSPDNAAGVSRSSLHLGEFNTHRVFRVTRRQPRHPRREAYRRSPRDPFIPEAFAANKAGCRPGICWMHLDNETVRSVWLPRAWGCYGGRRTVLCDYDVHTMGNGL